MKVENALVIELTWKSFDQTLQAKQCLLDAVAPSRAPLRAVQQKRHPELEKNRGPVTTIAAK